MMQALVAACRRFRGSQRGDDVYIAFLIKFVITMCIVATVISFYDIYVKHQHLVFIAKRLVRAIEVTGRNDAAVITLFNQLTTAQGLTGATFQVVNVSYFPGGGNRIQLRNTFTVVVSYNMNLRVAQFGGIPFIIPLVIESRLNGMSEVFHR